MPEQKSIHKTYLFIDESGDPVYYGNRKKLLVGIEGFQPYLIIGMIETGNRKALRKAVVNFMDRIKADSLYNSILPLLLIKADMFMPVATTPKSGQSSLSCSATWKATKLI